MMAAPGQPSGKAHCPDCGNTLGSVTRYCGNCGRPTQELSPVMSEETGGLPQQPINITAALAVVYCGALIVLTLESVCASPITRGLVHWLGLTATGGVAIGFLGRGSWFSSTHASITKQGFGLGVLGGLAMILIMRAYVAILLLAADEEGLDSPSPDAWEAIEVAILAPVVEEWLCRGVLWSAARRVVGVPWTIITTAALFGLLHGIGPGMLLEVPSRFGAGIVLGCLRAKTKSLGPCVLAHGLNNTSALLIG